MARQKQWTDEDREAALGWIERKAKTGVVFRGQDESGEAMLARLTAITDLADFAEAAQAALTQAAWKRLLGALRQRKHSADDEGQADDAGAQQADKAVACASCARLQDEVLSLQQALASAISASEAKIDSEADAGAQDRIKAAALDLLTINDSTELRHVDEAILFSALSQAVASKTTRIISMVNTELLRRAQGQDHHQGHQADDEVGQDEIGAGAQVQSPAPAPSPVSDRDQRIIAMKAQGASNVAIGRAIGCSEGTVRNVCKRHPHLLRAEKAAQRILDEAEADLERMTG